MKSPRILQIFAAAGLLISSQNPATAITIQLDFSHDSNGFFGVGTDQRNTLEAAADFVGGLFLDDLEAIEPDVPFFAGPGNQWEVEFEDPASASGTLFEDFLTVPADTIVVFAGGRSFSGTTLATAGFGASFFSGSAAFADTVETRGESGATSGPSATEFAPWGGFLSANSDTVWDYSLDGSTLDPDETHFYSVMVHELVHVFGVGTSDSWANLLSGSTFTGTETTALYGSAVPTVGTEHFANSVEGNVFGTNTAQTVSLAANLSAGETRFITDIDVAALDDIGWDVVSVPEPSSALLLLVSAGLAFTRRTRK